MFIPPDIISVRLKIIRDGQFHFGIGAAEKYSTGKIVIVERSYKQLSDIEVELLSIDGNEQIIEEYDDYGKLYDDTVSGTPLI